MENEAQQKCVKSPQLKHRRRDVIETNQGPVRANLFLAVLRSNGLLKRVLPPHLISVFAVVRASRERLKP